MSLNECQKQVRLKSFRAGISSGSLGSVENKDHQAPLAYGVRRTCEHAPCHKVALRSKPLTSFSGSRAPPFSSLAFTPYPPSLISWTTVYAGVGAHPLRRQVGTRTNSMGFLSTHLFTYKQKGCKSPCLHLSKCALIWNTLSCLGWVSRKNDLGKIYQFSY